MFGPVDAGSDDSGLGLVPQQVMRDAGNRYVPGDDVACVWEIPGTNTAEPQQP